MEYYQLFDIINTFSLVYIVLFIMIMLLRIDRYYKQYKYQRRLELTQNFINNNKEKLDIIRYFIQIKIDPYNNYMNQDDYSESKNLYSVLSFTNELTQCVKNEIYDSELLKHTCQHDLTMFYKLYFEQIDKIRFELGMEEFLYNIESILREWKYSTFKKRRM